MAIQIMILLIICINANASRHRSWKFCFVIVVVTQMIHDTLLVTCHWDLKNLQMIWENVQVSEVIASSSLLFPSPKFEKSNETWRVALTPHLLTWPILILVETLVTWWDRETSFKHSICILFWERSLFFFFLCTLTFYQNWFLMILIHLFLCGSFMLR